MMNSSLQDIVRYGVTILMAIYLFGPERNGASAAEMDYDIGNYDMMVKPPPKPREIRGFKPHSMSTAIGFGKRHSNYYQSSEPSSHEESIPLPLKDISKRFPMKWFIRVLTISPEITSKTETSPSNEENIRRLVLHRYKKKKNDDPLDYNE